MTRRLSWRWNGLLVAAVAVTVAAVFAVTTTGTAAPVANRMAARHAGRAAPHPAVAGPYARHPVGTGADAVGALFTWQDRQLGRHFCTASVVSSTAGDLVITAAHCVTGVDLANIVFAPGYANGQLPRGLWAVSRKFVDARWAAHKDPNDDFAFLVVRPLTKPHQSAADAQLTGTVQSAAGAERLRFDARLPTTIRATGYPDGSNRPVTCATRAVAFRPDALDQVKFVCPGFTDGTSGGPFLSDFSRATDTGSIIGVIGGYQQGGDSADISYSSAFVANVRSLYASAQRATRERRG